MDDPKNPGMAPGTNPTDEIAKQEEARRKQEEEERRRKEGQQ